MTGTHRTVVNNNDVTVYSNDSSTETRRFAADLQRGDERVNRVVSNAFEYATVWLASDAGAFHWTPPEGYHIADVYVSDGGATAVDVELMDA